MVVKQYGDTEQAVILNFILSAKISKGDISRDVTFFFFFLKIILCTVENGLLFLSFNTTVLPGKQNSLTSTV